MRQALIEAHICLSTRDENVMNEDENELITKTLNLLVRVFDTQRDDLLKCTTSMQQRVIQFCFTKWVNNSGG